MADFKKISIYQDVVLSDGNSVLSNFNLSAGNNYTFSGTSESTLNVVGIQVSLKTDVNCIVSVLQSPDSINWDVVDTYNYYTNDNFGITIQAISSYFKVNVAATTARTSTYFRLQSVLCPVVEALPRSLSHNENLKCSVEEIVNEFNDRVRISPYNGLQVEEPTKLIGSAFYGTTLDPNFWTSAATGTGSTIQSGGQVNVRTGSTANSSAKITSLIISRYIPGVANNYRSQIIQDAATANNVRQWGAFDGVDGMYYQLSGTTFGIVTCNNSVPTFTTSGFNGRLNDSFIFNNVNHVYEITYTNGRAVFYIDGVSLHKASVSTTRLCQTLNLPIWNQNFNIAGGTTDVQMKVITSSIKRLGKMLSQPRHKYQTGQSTSVLKYGAGNLHSIVVSSVVNQAVITLFDNTTTAGTVMFSTGQMSANVVPFSLPFAGVPFSNGLSLSISGAAANCTVLYE